MQYMCIYMCMCVCRMHECVHNNKKAPACAYMIFDAESWLGTWNLCKMIV